jgi:hypothetical protein
LGIQPVRKTNGRTEYVTGKENPLCARGIPMGQFEKEIALKEEAHSENTIRIQRVEAVFVNDHDFAVAKVQEAPKIALRSL